MNNLHSPMLLELGEKCCCAFLLRTNYGAKLNRSRKKHTEANENNDSSSDFTTKNSKMPLYSGHVPTSLLQKGT